MSEQNKSNFQALGAGLLGFVAVMALGGGGLMLHSSQRAKSAAAPVPAAAPIDLGSSLPAPSIGGSTVQSERRAQSPAPLIGEVGEEASAGGSAASAGASSSAGFAAPTPGAAPGAKAPALEVTQHLDLEPGNSSAKAVVKNTIEAKKPAAAPAAPVKKAPAPKLDIPAGEGAVASSVQYGVTNRSELMGRAAGPVYNFKGAGGGTNVAAQGKLADDADGKMADLRRQLEASGLPADQRAKLLKELDDAMKGVSATAKTAQ